MTTLGLETEIVDREVLDRTVLRFRERGITLPTFAELTRPETIPAARLERLAAVGPDDPDPANLFRVHWWNATDRRGRAAVPEHFVVPPELSGIEAPIVLLLGNRFPMIGAHKVLAAYACLVPRLVTGQFDPDRHRAVWPSTGNYCRGGVAISRILGCRGVAVLPEEMSRERFEWLGAWVADPADVIKTPGCESNVKEIYDECARLAADPANAIFNQFAEYPNHLVHELATGTAAEAVFDHVASGRPSLRLAAFVSASGSAGTIGAGNRLAQGHGAKVVAVEASECPTLLRNGYGGHNIQGIGDKHVPLIHDVMSTDVVVGVSERATDRLNVLFNTGEGRRYLVDRRGVPEAAVARLGDLGLSSICNLVAAIKTAKLLGLGPDDAIVTIATDGAAMYRTELEGTLASNFRGGFDAIAAAEVAGEHLSGIATDDTLELRREDRERIFNLGYYTWVEQQGVPLEEFDRRRERSFWAGLKDLLPMWDERIREINARVAAAPVAQR